jgi:SAM-dependent methyltransferase
MEEDRRMYEPNVEAVLKMIGPNDLVLEIGGWARRFNRTSHVIDAESYETRGWLAPSQGSEREHFTKGTGIQRDICDKQPYPFPDKFFDFVTCSQTLGDVRDPPWVCAEMIRVAKHGCIEVPSSAARVLPRGGAWASKPDPPSLANRRHST